VSPELQSKSNVIPAADERVLDSQPSFFSSALARIPTLLRAVWNKSIDIFKFLPIRFKLSLIIGGIVVLVIAAFSLIVLQSQRIALMQRMTQVCNVLIQNLAESVKGDLLLGNNDKVTEAVWRLKNSSIEGLKQVAILNHKGKLVASFDRDGESITFEHAAEILKFTSLTTIEKQTRYEFYHPIMTQLQAGSELKPILLGVAFVSFSKRSILAPIEHARNIAIGSALFIILFSILGINRIARRMAHQIQLLSNGAREVGNGNLDVQISVSSKDELGLLAREFNNMIQQLREKLQMQKFVSKLTVEMIKDSVSDGKSSRASTRHVAVLFTDVRNFSSIAEKLDPEEIVKLINIYFDLQTKIIERYHGIVDKFMGDQIMAVFQGNTTMADNVLRAAVEIQRQVRLLNQERAAAGRVTLEVGIGVNHGAAVMGHMGSSHRMDYTVLGDVVNVASRLCAHAKAGQIITSSELTQQVNSSYPTTRLKSISVKGRTKAIEVCEVDYDRDILL
jgi:adenylate cyclase